MVTRRKNPLVSVIIPTFNRDRMLPEAIESVLVQDFADFELIVVDDGSTDNTNNVLKQYQNDVIVLKQVHGGVSAARNKGIAAAAGHFIALLDSDDIWMPTKLSMQVAFFNSNPDALICQTEEIWIRNGVKINPKNRHKKISGDIFEASLSLCLVSPSAVMMKRCFFKKVGVFDENLPACEDYDLWLRTSCRYPVYLINTPLIIKRGGHADQLSKTSGLDKFRIEALKKLIGTNLLSKDQYRAAVRILKEKCAIYASGCRKRGRKDEASYYIKLADSYS